MYNEYLIFITKVAVHRVKSYSRIPFGPVEPYG